MTDLQLYSLIGGGAIVVLVYAYNWWQERRYRKQVQKSFARNQPDVLLETPKNMVRSGETHRLEPIIHGQPKVEPKVESKTEPVIPVLRAVEPEVPVAPAHAAEPFNAIDDEDLDDFVDPEAALAARKVATQVHVEPVKPEPVRQEPQFSAAAPVAHEPEREADEVTSSLLDPALDFIAEIHAGELIPAANVPIFPGAKRIVTLGLRDDDQWEVVHHSGHSRYTELRVGLQLADRQGALTQEQLNAFCMGVQQFADEFDAVVTFPQRSGKIAAAQSLDQFCAGVDVLIGLNILPAEMPFPMEKVRVLAENAGLVRGPDGCFHYRSDSGKTLFTLANQDETPFGTTSDGLTLLFDVPRVAGGLAVFDYLADFAHSLSSALGGELADDNGKPLTEASLANIRKQLTTIYARMDDKGIAAGSMAALRLFA
ncbi:ZipA, C-terminal FtsZ-binding domain [Formivibrio citricus]|uniref:Cell division protein ZipA n=1 Tax=Formivibrio citricus TaxID=83765 RepID=A0A1I4WBT2_9NEIS|nr:cell division protein ZipA C-terminal FtsZ-binding domain-containing protein [Formivibrio citricus]SFN10686.1 ZipA, C-terminal FtsZ-binding domain [Formivibrio citricus]